MNAEENGGFVVREAIADTTISNASLRQPGTSGSNISYEGQYEILSLSGSFIRAEQGGKTGGLNISSSGSDGQIVGGAIGTHLTAAAPVQVILGTFQFDRKKDSTGSGGKLSPKRTEASMYEIAILQREILMIPNVF